MKNFFSTVLVLLGAAVACFISLLGIAASIAVPVIVLYVFYFLCCVR